MTITPATTIAAPLPPCPWCKTVRHVQPAGQPRSFYCRKCRREFDDGDDGDSPGGDTIGYGRPDRRLEREERQKLQREMRRIQKYQGMM
jgi:hypothetical protein